MPEKLEGQILPIIRFMVIQIKTNGRLKDFLSKDLPQKKPRVRRSESFRTTKNGFI